MAERESEHDAGKLKLFTQHQSALIEHAAPIVGRAHAEDVVQEAFVRFTTTRGSTDPVERPAAYLFRIVRNLALDWLRRMNADTRRSGEFRHASDDWQASPEEELLHRDELRRVDDALLSLPARTRRTFELHRFDGQTLQQIAVAEGISVTTAHRLVQEALVELMRARQGRKGGRP